MAQSDGVFAQALSDTIGAIYDCALDQERWPDTLGRIAALCESPYCGLAVNDLRRPESSCLIDYGYPAAFCELSGKYVNDNPVLANVCLMTVGDVVTLGMTCADEELLDSRYDQRVLKPFGIRDQIGLLALRTGSRIAYVHASRKEDASRYCEDEVRLFGLLSPHVCRAMAIADALDLRTLRSEMLETTLDSLATGVYLTARDGRVVHMNSAAEDQARIATAVRIVNKRIFAIDATARTLLANAISEVTAAALANHPVSRSLAIPDAQGSGYVATLLPLESGRRHSVMAPFEALVAIFMQDPGEVPLMPGEAFARLYSLTGGELRVLLTIAQGMGAKDAADVLGLSEPTVRTHLQHVFSKTGTTRQAELLHLLRNSAPPTRTTEPKSRMI